MTMLSSGRILYQTPYGDLVPDAVRKIRHRSPMGILDNNLICERILRNTRDGVSNVLDEAFAQTWILGLVPVLRLGDIGLSNGRDADGTPQEAGGRRKSRSIVSLAGRAAAASWSNVLSRSRITAISSGVTGTFSSVSSARVGRPGAAGFIEIRLRLRAGACKGLRGKVLGGATLHFFVKQTPKSAMNAPNRVRRHARH